MVLSLARKLVAWKEAGLLTEEQMRAIEAFERKSSRPWATYGLAGIGIATVATGVISLVAANWAALPPLLKIAVYLMLQAGLGYWAFTQFKRPGIWRETSLVAYAVGYLAGIGLVAQVFHLEGSGWRALAFWLLLSAPAVLHAEGRYFNHAWVLTLFYTVGMWAATFRHPWLTDERRVSLVASLPLFLSGLGFLSERFFRLPMAFRAAILTWGLATTLIGGTVLGNVLWHAGPDAEVLRLVPYLSLPWSALLFASAASWIRGNAVSRALRGTTSFTLLFWGLYATLPLLFDSSGLDPMLRRIIGAAGFMAIGLLCSGAAALAGYRRLYDLATLLVTGRMVFVYFEVFGSLIQTGVGLIITGLFLLALARLWQKHRGRFLTWMEGHR